MKTFYLGFECERMLIEAQIEGVLEKLLQHGLFVKSEELAINYQNNLGLLARCLSTKIK